MTGGTNFVCVSARCPTAAISSATWKTRSPSISPCASKSFASRDGPRSGASGRACWFRQRARTGEALRELRGWGWVEGIDRFGDVDVFGGGVANVAVAVLAVLVLGFFVERVSSF